MNQPVNVEERSQHDFDIGLYLPRFLRSRRWCAPLGGHLLSFRVTPLNPAFVTSDYRGHEVGIVFGSITEVSANWHAIVLFSAVRRRGTNFAVTRLIPKYSVTIFWHVPNAILTSSATSLIVRRRSARMISRTHATVFSVWEVEGLLGGCRLQRIGVHFWNGNTTQMSSIDLGRTLRKLLAAFRKFQH